jgi:predicted metal-dependent enzyme (double-stranded beta helix superfamily)
MEHDMDAAEVRPVRAVAIAATVDGIRAIERTEGVSRASLEVIKAEMLQLAARAHLFPCSQLPPPSPGEPRANRYLLRDDTDGRFALYLNALNRGDETKPYDHTTWAVVVAVERQEPNKIYRRSDDGRDPERCKLAVDHEIMVEPGRGIALMPNDIRSIHTTGSVPNCHLHMYGLARWPARLRSGDRPGCAVQQKLSRAVGEPASLMPP